MKFSVAARVWVLPLMVLMTSGSKSNAQELDEQEAPPAVANVFELHESVFDQWVFGNAGRANSTKDQLDTLLTLSIGEVERCCELSESQKKKLTLAGHGDIKHFMDRVAEARRVFDILRRDQNNMNEIFQETQPLSATLRSGLFGLDSFFAKTIGTTLEPEQAARYQQSINEKNLFRHRAKVRLAITNLDNSVGFTAEQRRRFTELAMEETKPSIKSAGQYEPTVVLLKLSQIPEAKLRPIFDDRRWKLLNQQLQQGRGMEQFLKAQGLLDDPVPTPTVKPVENKKE